MFRYETKDGMEIYEFQVTLKQKELSFRLYAWDGAHMSAYTQSGGCHLLFFQFLKNTYFSNKNEMIFMISGRKSKNYDMSPGFSGLFFFMRILLKICSLINWGYPNRKGGTKCLMRSCSSGV